LSFSSHLARSLLFSSLIALLPPSPTPPLFPYTTLFRSRTSPAGRRLFLFRLKLKIHGITPLLRRRHDGQHRPGGQAGGGLVLQGDRKSTRLNSSHVSISYAVFCLKKKTRVHSTHRHVSV